MTTPASSSRRLRWPQFAGLAVAGLLSFALAAYWSVAAGEENDDLVMPVMRSRTAAGTDSSHLRVDSSLDLLQPLGEPTLQMTANPARVNSQVTRNPFGDLNLLASVELAASRNDVNTVRTTAPAPKSRKPKMAPPPPPPPVVEAPPPPPPPPTAPILPFTVVGGISGQRIAEGRPVAFLRQNDEVIVVRPGDEIGKAYRVESITVDSIAFTYLPLRQRQTLSMKP